MSIQFNREKVVAVSVLFQELEIGDLFVYDDLPGSMEVYIKTKHGGEAVNLRSGNTVSEDEYGLIYPVNAELSYKYQYTLSDN